MSAAALDFRRQRVFSCSWTFDEFSVLRIKGHLSCDGIVCILASLTETEGASDPESVTVTC